MLRGIEVVGIFVSAENVDGVAADAETRAGNQAVIDGVADGRVGGTGALGAHVTLGGEAGHQISLCRQRRQDGALRHRLLHGLQVFRAGVEEEMDVGVDQSGHESHIAEVDDLGSRGSADTGTHPGDAIASPNWPGTAPGERGVNNAISPRYCDVSGFAGIAGNSEAQAAGLPDVLWIRGDADQIVSDASLVDLGNLGRLGAVPGWPGPGVFPPQPMIGQMRAVLDRYRAAGGHYQEHVLAGCGHSPHLERPAEFNALVAGFLADAG